VLHPQEKGVPSKTGQYDESMINDNPEYEFLNVILAQAICDRDPSSQLFPGSYLEWADVFKQAGVAVGLQPLGPPVLYQLRHGGASHEVLMGRRTLQELKKRGRWASDSSVKRYEKGGRLNQQLALLPVTVQQASYRAAASIEQGRGILFGTAPSDLRRKRR